MELRRSLVAKLQQELFVAPEPCRPSQAPLRGSVEQEDVARNLHSNNLTVPSVWTMPVVLMNASACYQAAYRWVRSYGTAVVR